MLGAQRKPPSQGYGRRFILVSCWDQRGVPVGDVPVSGIPVGVAPPGGVCGLAGGVAPEVPAVPGAPVAGVVPDVPLSPELPAAGAVIPDPEGEALVLGVRPGAILLPLPGP